MPRQRSEEVMRRYLTEVVAQGKLELIDELAAEDMVDHHADDPRSRRTRRPRQELPRAQPRCRTHRRADRRVRRRSGRHLDRRATHSTDMYGVPPLGGKLEVRVASIFRLRDGMLVDYEVISDALTGFRRMGADVQINAPRPSLGVGESKPLA